MATRFSDAQVASYIQNNALSGAGLQQAAQAFQLDPAQVARAQGLLSSGDASVAAASNAYNQQVAGRPDLVAQNLATYNPATGIGSLVQPQATTPAPITPPPPTPTGLSSAQTKYYDQLIAGGGYDKQTALDYVKGLNDLQSLASLANTQGKFSDRARGGLDQQIQQLEGMYNAPIVSYRGDETRKSTYTPVLYKDLTKTSTPDQVAAAYRQFTEGAGGDTATNQREAVAYLQKIGIPDSVISQGYNVYRGLGTTGTTGTATSANVNQPLYKSLTSASTADDIARAYYQLVSGAGGDTQTNQQEAVAYLKKLGISDPMIESGYKDYREMAGLKSSFGLTDAVTTPTTDGILSGFKYANEKGIDENTMKQVLGDDTFNKYKTGFANFAKTGIASVLADNKLSFDEAGTTVKFGRDYGYDAQKLADLTGTDKKVFDAIFKKYDEDKDKVINSVLKADNVKTAGDQINGALALGKKYGFTDEDFSKATGLTLNQVKGFLDPVRNFESDYKKLLEDPNRSEDQMKTFLTSSLQNPFLKEKLGDKLQPALDELNRPPRERLLDQIGQQQKVLGGNYYRGVFGNPEVITDVLERKGVKSLADLGQKDKFEATPAEKRYFAPDGTPVDDLGNGTFGVMGSEGGYGPTFSKSQVKTVYGRTESTMNPDGESSTSRFIEIPKNEIDKDGNYQQKIGTVVVNKRTGEELTDTDHRLAVQSSSGGLKKKSNSLKVNFTKDGVPVLTASSERAGLGGLVQDLAPIISMALPFVLPGLGAGLSSMLPGAGAAATATSAAVAPTLINQALTQGIISGGLTTLGGGQFEKGFLGGAVNPVINAGIGSLLPAGLSENATNAIRGVGTNVIRGVLQGESFGDLLGQGVLSGLTNYGLNTALGSSGFTPQQLNFATGIALPLLQGEKVSPIKLMTTLASAAQQQPKGRTP